MARIARTAREGLGASRPKRPPLAASPLAFASLVAVLTSIALFIAYPLARLTQRGFVDDQGAPGLALGVLAGNLDLIANSAFVGALVAVASTALALAVALAIAYGNRLFSRALLGISMLSLISPPFVASLAYLELFGKSGLVTYGLLGLRIDPYGWVGVVLMQTLFFTAINVLLLVSVLRRLDRRMFEAARDLGSTSSTVLRRIVLPLLRPSILVCMLLTFVRSISDYGTPVVIGGSFETVATEIYMQIIGYSDLQAAAALNILLAAVAIVVFAAYGRLSKSSDGLVSGSMDLSAGVGDRTRPESPLQLKGVIGCAAGIVAGLFLAFMIALYATIVRAAFTAGIGWNASFTLSHITHLADYDLAPLGRSLVFALIAALAGTVIGALVAYFADRRAIAFGKGLKFLVTMPYMLPGTCLGLGYILAFNAPPLKLTATAAIIVLVLTFKQLAISTNAFSTTMAQISPELDMAARDLGASEARTFVQVLLPNLRTAAAVGFVDAFSSAMCAYGAVIFLVSPSHKVAIFELFDALAGGKYGEAAAISLAIIALTVFVNVAFAALMLSRRHTNRA